MAISGETVVIGADFETSGATGVNGDQNDSSAYDSGAAYVFVRSGTAWSQQAYLKASNTESLDRFGTSVAVSGDIVAVGADFEASNSTGVNGNQAANSISGAGAAYVFVRIGTTWSQRAYLKASNTPGTFGGGDQFGYAVAVSDDTAVVGAWAEDSNATGVNGDQGSNLADRSGAAYVFTGFCASCPQLFIVPDGSGGYFLRFTGAPDVTYRVERAPSPAGPWDNTLATLSAPASGLVEFHDTTPPPAHAFYRTAQR